METKLFINSGMAERTSKGADSRLGRCVLDNRKIDDYPMSDDIVTGVVIIGASGPVDEVLLQN
jgi:hypothetical protein